MFRVSKLIQSLIIMFLRWLKKFDAFQSIILFTGEFEAHHWCKKTGKTTIDKLPVTLFNSLPFFNTTYAALLNYIAQIISTTGNASWIGVNGLMAGTLTGTDGIVFTETSENDYATTTTKYSGGTGSSASVVFKGVRTAAATETIETAELGLNHDGTNVFNTLYASQTYAKTLASGDILTVYWTLTIS